LKIVRVWGCIDIPDRVFGVIYSTDWDHTVSFFYSHILQSL
jgi:hypothetical protein